MHAQHVGGVTQLAAEKARKEAEKQAAAEAEAARRAEDDRTDRDAAAARVAQAQERRASAADGALSRSETEFGKAWACEPAVRLLDPAQMRCVPNSYFDPQPRTLMGTG